MSTDIERLKLSRPGLIPLRYWNDLVDIVHSALITSFVGGTFERSVGGTKLLSLAGGAAAAASQPFQILTQSKPGSETGEMQWGVVYTSRLYDSPKPDDKISITGLLPETVESDSEGWLDLMGNDAIWLTVCVDSAGETTSVTINSWKNGDDFDVTADAWSGNNGFCEDDGGDPAVFQTVRKLIGYSIADAAGTPVVTQSITHDQLLRPVCVAGRPAQLLFDHSGGYPF
jgi:hypothetical protein